MHNEASVSQIVAFVPSARSVSGFRSGYLPRIIHEDSTAEADPGVSTALRSFGLLDVLSNTPAGPSVARLVAMPVCASSLRTFMNNAGYEFDLPSQKRLS
jgi:hypothetical protein